ncbi:hypothetical protein PV399_42085, partial [Streptomyces acidiscabies]|nr:hypothetical protein [Streptomyces acidiscabies]MDX3796326.1 hypothetical protein [Streptomyces acidiscabies]
DPQVPCSSASEARQHDQPAQAGAIRANAGALGFGVEGVLPGEFLLDGEYVDDVLMGRGL